MDYCNYLIEQDDSLDRDRHNLKTELTAMPSDIVEDIVEDIDADMAPFCWCGGRVSSDGTRC